MKKKLSEFRKGERGKVLEISGEALKLALLGIGLAEGMQFTLTETAPFNGPLALHVLNTKIAIRKGDADKITAEAV